MANAGARQVALGQVALRSGADMAHGCQHRRSAARRSMWEWFTSRRLYQPPQATRSRLSPRGSSFPRHRKPPRPRRALWGHGRLIPVGHGTPGGALLCGTKRGRDVRAWMLDATLSFTIWRLSSAAASWRRGVRGSNPEKFGERWRSIIYRPRRAGFPAGSWPVSCRTACGRVVMRRQ